MGRSTLPTRYSSETELVGSPQGLQGLEEREDPASG